MDEPRLIDANRLMKELFETSLWDNQDEDVFTDLIDNQPTAYDIDKIVEQLKEQKQLDANSIRYLGFCYRCTWKVHNGAIDKAIEIVKGGGTNE